jgi:hypothetical protein
MKDMKEFLFLFERAEICWGGFIEYLTLIKSYKLNELG